MSSMMKLPRLPMRMLPSRTIPLQPFRTTFRHPSTPFLRPSYPPPKSQLQSLRFSSSIPPPPPSSSHSNTSLLPSTTPQILFFLSLTTSSFLLAAYLTNVSPPASPPAPSWSAQFSRLPAPKSEWERLKTIVNKRWGELKEGQKTSLGVIGVMGTVWVAWQIPSKRWQQGMMKYMWHDPLSGRRVTLLTAVFSHKGFAHLAFNSLALYSFAPSTFAYLDLRLPFLDPNNYFSRDTSTARKPSAYEFIAFFIGAGVFSSLISHLYSIRYLLLKQLRSLPSLPSLPSGYYLSKVEKTAIIKEAGQTIPILPSLGASGAVYGMLTMTALSFPMASVSLIFLPWIPIPIGTATLALVGVDLCGLIFRWRMFDHAAHLSGALYGALYWVVGHEFFEVVREMMLGWV